MKPSGPFSERHLLIAVDCFSKWVELVPLRTKESIELAEWLLHELVPRYGVPRFIRTDAGLEFQGAFKECCDALGIRLRRTSGGVPQSNGQAERWVREVKRALRKYLVGAAHTKWWHWLGHVRLGLRACVSRSHGFAPFTLLFK